VKDIGEARQVIESGGVPAPEMIITEGLISEHDFATEGGACTDRFCARPAVGRYLLRSSGEQTTFVQVGMLSGLPADWTRPAADIVVAVDKGWSMAGDLAQTLEGIALMIDRLRPDDRFGMVVFDDTARMLIPLGAVTDKATLKARVQNVQATGGFAGVVDGAKLALDALAAAQQQGRLSRMMLFACGYPPSLDMRFDSALKGAAARGIGASFFVILVGGSNESLQYFSNMYGGNAFFLDDLETVKTVFDTDLDLIITPLAYDLSLKLIVSGATVKRVWGLPEDRQELQAVTVFPSRNRGAIIVQLDAPAGADIASLMTLDFGYREQLDAQPVQASVGLMAETHGGVRKAAAVVNLADGLKAALADWQQARQPQARTEIDDLKAYVEGEAAALDDDQLRREVAMLEKLRANMR
jgi:hypothetical protein